MFVSSILLSFLISFASSTTEEDCAVKTNCLSCLEVENCYFCYKFEDQKGSAVPKCLLVNSTSPVCVDSDKKRSKRCVEELGGDKDSVRYAIGFTILGVSILIDLAIRLCSRRKALKDEYSHL